MLQYQRIPLEFQDSLFRGLRWIPWSLRRDTSGARFVAPKRLGEISTISACAAPRRRALMDICAPCGTRLEGIGVWLALWALEVTLAARYIPIQPATDSRLDRMSIQGPLAIDARDQRTLARPVALCAIPA